MPDGEGVLRPEQLIEVLLDMHAGDDDHRQAGSANRAAVENCASRWSNEVLDQFMVGQPCPDVTIEKLAAAIFLRQWLGDSNWDGQNRHSGDPT